MKFVTDTQLLGAALTVLQMGFVVLFYLPSFLHRRNNVAGFKSLLPAFDKPAVPLTAWGVQVLVLLAVNIFNNWTFIYKIPLTLQIVFRSSGMGLFHLPHTI
jgi:solute carrier family 35 (UDP-xylose/UDP-N-acetylglucosamine transporter), member B4